jgi:thiamine-monophosphate kinase
MSKSENGPTPLSEFGEFKLIKHLTENINIKNRNVLMGVGDDAAVLVSDKKRMLVTTDMLCEGIHFDLLYMPAKHLGYKSIIVNLSDIYAMNGKPRQVTISLGLSNRMSVEFLEDFYDGVRLACENYGVDLIGGDTVSSYSGLVISVTALGDCDEGEEIYRSGANENDLICVSGDLGGAYMGLQLLEREKAVFEESKNIQPDLSGYDYVLERQLKPEARHDVIEALKESGVRPTSMIDISDGLSSDLLHICQDSKLGCSLYEEKIPIDPTTMNLAEDFKIGGITAALNGGEDYELLFTVDIKDHEKIKNLSGISIIGHMTGKNEACQLVTTGGSVVELKAQGWNAFED